MPLLPSQPFHSSSAGLAVASPSPTPSQPRGAASTGGLGTGPWPSGFAYIRRPRSRATASFPSRGAPGAAAKVSGRAGVSSALKAPCPLPGAPCSRPHAGSAHRHLVPTHLGWTWLRQPQRSRRERRNPQGVGRRGSRDAHTGSRVLPAPGERTPPAGHLLGSLARGSRAGSGGSAGRGAADSQGRLGGAGSPAPSPRAGLTRVQRLLGMHCPLGHGAGQSFVPEQGGACDGVYVGYSLDQCL